MTRMKYTLSVAMGPLEHLTGLARTAEEVGFDSIALPDSLFYMEKQAADYPYTPDGSRMWNAETPWVDPPIARGLDGCGNLDAAVLHQRHEARVAQPAAAGRQVGSVANLTNNRFGFGVGIGWAPEEFEWCGGVSVRQARGARRRDDRRAQARARRRHGRVPRRVLAADFEHSGR